MRKTVWHNAHHWQHGDLPTQLRAWLLDSTSMTQRLRTHCGAQFQVAVLEQSWQHPQLDEARWLGLPVRQYARVRQVYLCCQQQPWLFGRTVIPLTMLYGNYRYLTRLGDQPLGAVLFAHHSLRRSDLQFTRLRQGDSLYTLATKHLENEPPLLYARRSVFYLEHKPLLVTEVFLPEMLNALAD